jgi:hypothetical protein
MLEEHEVVRTDRFVVTWKGVVYWECYLHIYEAQQSYILAPRPGGTCSSVFSGGLVAQKLTLKLPWNK